MLLSRLRYRLVAWLIPAILRLRRTLLWCADAIVPAALPLYAISTGVAQTQILASFVALGLPERLARGPATLAELSDASGAQPDMLMRFLRACEALKLVMRCGDHTYRQTARSIALRRDISGGMGAFAIYMASTSNVAAWSGLQQVVRSGRDAFTEQHHRSVWSYFEAHPEQSAPFVDAMTALTQADGPAIAHAYPFARHARICDVGGGQGALLEAIIGVHPSVRGLVFDQASVVAEAVDDPGPAKRTATLHYAAGSFFDGVPAGCNAYILRHILHDWDDAACTRILAHCAAAMGPSSRLLIIESQLGCGQADFVDSIKDLTMAVVCGGRERDKLAMTALLAHTGLKLVHLWPVATAVFVWEVKLEVPA